MRCKHVINAHDYINIFKMRHNILPYPARLRRAYPQINTVYAFYGYPYTTMPHILQMCPHTYVARVSRHDWVMAYESTTFLSSLWSVNLGLAWATRPPRSNQLLSNLGVPASVKHIFNPITHTADDFDFYLCAHYYAT